MTATTAERTFSIAEAASATGLTPHTLRYYERDGLLLDPVDRASSGHRRYTAHDLGWVQMLIRLRATGMPIREIREYAALVRQGDGNEVQRLELLLAHRDKVRTQLIEAQEHLTAIEAKIDIYLDRVAGGGPVPEGRVASAVAC